MGWLRVFPSTIGALWSTVRGYSVAWKRYRRPLIAVQGPISSYHASATARAEAPKVGRTPASQYSTLKQATKWDLQNWVNSPIPLRFCQIRCRFTYLCVKQPEYVVLEAPRHGRITREARGGETVVSYWPDRGYIGGDRFALRYPPRNAALTYLVAVLP